MWSQKLIDLVLPLQNCLFIFEMYLCVRLHFKKVCGADDDAQMALAEAIYFSGSPMMMVDNAHWKTAWKRIGEFGPGFDPPSYHSMRNDLLEKCYAQVKERVQRVVLSNIELSGCDIVSDGWSNV